MDVSGVGYRVSIPLSTFCKLPPAGDLAALEIHTLVRDDAILLYGFATEAEKTLFESLLSVSGVGPKVALAVLSGLSADELAGAIQAGNAARLKAVPGVGRKLAERIVLELKEKVARLPLPGAGADSGGAGGEDSEAESALVNLGYAAAEARRALRIVRERTAGSSAPIEVLLREALKVLGR